MQNKCVNPFFYFCKVDVDNYKKSGDKKEKMSNKSEKCTHKSQ